MADPTISVIIISRDEAEDIEDCLRSVSWAHEIVVVDSVANTPEASAALVPVTPEGSSSAANYSGRPRTYARGAFRVLTPKGPSPNLR